MSKNFTQPGFPDGTMAAVAYQGTLRDARKNARHSYMPCRLGHHLSVKRSKPSPIVIRLSNPRRRNTSLCDSQTKTAGGSCAPTLILPPAFSHFETQDNVLGEKPNRFKAIINRQIPILVDVIRQLFQPLPRSLGQVAHVDLLGNSTRGVTQGVGNIDHRKRKNIHARGIFTQDQNTGANGVGCR